VKLLATILAACTVCCALGQRNNTLDLNYNASYRNSLNFRWSSRLSEASDWGLMGFNTGASWSANQGLGRLSVTYDMFRGYEPCADIGARYGLAYSLSTPTTGLNLSLYNTSGTRNDGVSAKLDINMKFGG
jgi:hypothetical protein